MERHWIEVAQRECRQVGVLVGALAAEVHPRDVVPKLVPALVVEPAESPGLWWLDVEVIPGRHRLQQKYREEEILGLWPRYD